MTREVACACHFKCSGPGFEMLSKCILNCIRGLCQDRIRCKMPLLLSDRECDVEQAASFQYCIITQLLEVYRTRTSVSPASSHCRTDNKGFRAKQSGPQGSTCSLKSTVRANDRADTSNQLCSFHPQPTLPFW